MIIANRRDLFRPPAQENWRPARRVTAITTEGETVAEQDPQVDVVVVGAGFAGLHLLHRLQKDGFTARAFDAADDVGGT